jgi:hypothetical protein
MQIEFVNTIKEPIEMEYTKVVLLDLSELTRTGDDAATLLQSRSQKKDRVERQADALKRSCRRGYVQKDRLVVDESLGPWPQ